MKNKFGSKDFVFFSFSLQNLLPGNKAVVFTRPGKN